MCVRVQRSESHIHRQPLVRQANYPRLLATGYVEIIESILWLDDRNYEYGSFETEFVLSIECV